jgi:hypothetical protein
MTPCPAPTGLEAPGLLGASRSPLPHDSHGLAPGPGVALFCGYIALAITVAAVLLVRRDT